MVVAVSVVVVVGGRVVGVVMSRSMERVRGERVTLECLRGKVTTGLYILYQWGGGDDGGGGGVGCGGGGGGGGGDGDVPIRGVGGGGQTP